MWSGMHYRTSKQSSWYVHLTFLPPTGQHVLTYFKIPYSFQHCLSSQRTPVLADTLPAIERLMKAWEALAISQPHLAKFINAGLQKLHEGYNKMDLTWAYVMALGEFLH